MPIFKIFSQPNRKKEGNFGTTFFTLLKEKRIKAVTGVVLYVFFKDFAKFIGKHLC